MENNSTVENTTKTNTQDITVPTTGSYFHSYPDNPKSKSITVRNVSFASDDMFDSGISYKTSDGKELKLFNMLVLQETITHFTLMKYLLQKLQVTLLYLHMEC